MSHVAWLISLVDLSLCVLQRMTYTVTVFNLKLWLKPSPSLNGLVLPPACSLFAFRLNINLSPPLLLQQFPPPPVCLIVCVAPPPSPPPPMTLVEPGPLYSSQLEQLNTVTHTHTQALRQASRQRNRYHDPARGHPPTPHACSTTELWSRINFLKTWWGISEEVFLFFSILTTFDFSLNFKDCYNNMSVRGKKAGLVISWHKSFSMLAPWRKGTVIFYFFCTLSRHYPWFNLPNQLIICVRSSAAEIQRVCFIILLSETLPPSTSSHFIWKDMICTLRASVLCFVL